MCILVPCPRQSNTTATLSYNNFNHFTEWNAGSTNQEWYLYDAAGNRVLRRFTNGSGTTMIVYAFGLEEHNYSGAGAHQNDTYYYRLGGRLLGALDSNGTTFYLTDTLGSILARFNNAPAAPRSRATSSSAHMAPGLLRSCPRSSPSL